MVVMVDELVRAFVIALLSHSVSIVNGIASGALSIPVIAGSLTRVGYACSDIVKVLQSPASVNDEFAFIATGDEPLGTYR